MGSDPFSENPQLVSNGLEKSSVCHPSATPAPQVPESTLRNTAFDSHDRGLELALEKTADIGDISSFQLRSRIFAAHPFLSNSLAHNYLRITERKSVHEANRDLQNLHDSLMINDFNVSFKPEDVTAFAKRKALQCSSLLNNDIKLEESYLSLCEIVTKYGINPPEPKKYQGLISPCIERMSNPSWWRKKLKTIQLQKIDNVARQIGLVNKHASTYSSVIAQNARKFQKAQNENYLNSHFIENECGEKFSLKDIYNRNVSNPAIRRTELMVRLRGFEEISTLMNHAGEFYTMTAPASMHASLAKTGQQNPNFDGSTVRDAHELIHNQGRCALAKLKRKGIEVYGFRVVEPHHDGTPHYHWLLFMSPEHRKMVRKVFKHYSLRDNPNERGAKKHRFKAEEIKSEKGGATAYIAKYISKNIDGIHIDNDQYQNSGVDAAKAIDAWASTHKIRQFQQIGGHSVTVWRELRKMGSSGSIEVPRISKAFIEAYKAADSSNWAAYTLAMGGPFRGSGTKPLIKTHYEDLEYFDHETGEIFEDNLTSYGDYKPPAIKGIECDHYPVITRLHTWTLISEHPPPDG